MLDQSLLRSLRIQRRIISALFLREVLTRYGRHNLGFLWLFLEPMLFTIGVAALWVAMGATHGSSLPIIGFALTGYSTVLLWRNMPSRCLNAIGPNLSLMHHRNVRLMDLFMARLLLEFAGVTTSFVILTMLFVATGSIDVPEDVLQVASGWLMLAWFGAVLAIFVSCAAEQSEIIDKVWHPLSYLLFPLSGAAYMVDWLPPAARSVVLLLPMVHCAELVREGFFGSVVRSHYDITYVLACNMVLSLLALALMREVGRKVIAE